MYRRGRIRGGRGCLKKRLIAYIRARLDYPGVSCDNCKDALLIDEVEPACWVGECLLPEIGERERRVLEIRDRLVALNDLGIGGEILRMYEADVNDIELLAAVEEELKALGKPGNKDQD